MRQRWGRLGLVLLVVTLAAICSRASASPPPDCSQFNTSGCTYTWDRHLFCCVPSGSFCVWHCI